MKSIVLLCFVSFAFAAHYEQRYEQMKKDLVGRKLTWKHGLNEGLMGKSKFYLRRMTGANKEGAKKLPVRAAAVRTELPENFDAREEWPNCRWLSIIRDQSNCGSCWAVSAASVMSDRQCILTYGEKQPYISDQYLLSCCPHVGSCNGGSPYLALLEWKNGIPTGGPYGTDFGCQPYSIACSWSYNTENPCWEYAKTPTCSHECIKGFNASLEDSKYYGASAYRYYGMQDAMQDLYINGPLIAVYKVYEDFDYYKSGVYRHQWGNLTNYHAVRVIGWGITNDEQKTPYWLATNSWSSRWGDKGTFKILRGSNECGIESGMTSGLPKIDFLI